MVIGGLRGTMFNTKKWLIAKVLAISLIIGCIVTPALMAQRGIQLPDNRIVFSWNRNGNYDLYLMDGATQQIVSPLTDNTASDLTPVWSPDGAHVALTSNVNKTYEIYVLNASTNESVALTNNSWDDLYPAWSPDGKQIAFTSNRDSNWDIYVMDANGKNQKRLTTDAGYQGSPVWSPDGKQIVYVEGLDTKRDIMVMDADGSNVQPLTTNPASADYSPAWSPAGNQIAFVSNRNGNPDIFVVDTSCIGNSDLCDQQAVDLTGDNQGDDLDPAWRPDGLQLVFASTRNSATDLYLVDVNGSNLTQITTGDGEKRFPSWWHQP